MTVVECTRAYGLRMIPAIYGDNIVKLSRRIYGDDTDGYRRIIIEVNRRLDWYQIPPGDSILYIDQSLIYQIDSFMSWQE